MVAVASHPERRLLVLTMILSAGLHLWLGISVLSKTNGLGLLSHSLPLQPPAPAATPIQIAQVIEIPPEEPPQEPEKERRPLRLGIEASTADTKTWLGFAEAEEHLVPVASEVEQAALTPDDVGGAAGGTPDSPGQEPTPPVAIAPPPSPPPAPPVPEDVREPEPPADAANPVDEPVSKPADESPEPVNNELVPTPAPVEDVPPVNEAEEGAEPVDGVEPPEPQQPEPQPMRPSEEPLPRDAQPERQDTPAEPQPEAAPETPAPAPEEPVTSPEPAPQQPQPSQPPAVPPPGQSAAPSAGNGTAPGAGEGDALRRGQRSDKESPAAALKRAVKYRPGKPLAVQGLEVRTVEPRFPVAVRLTSSPRNPVVVIHFNRRGVVTRAEFLKDEERRTIYNTGTQAMDEPLLTAIYQWRAKGRELEALPADDPEATVSFVMEIYLRH